MSQPSNFPRHPRSTLAQKKTADAVCDQFEAAWNGGRRPSIEAYLVKVPPIDRRVVFRELLLTELALCRTTGKQLPAARYLERFAEYRDIVADIMASIPEASGDWLAAQQAALVQSVRLRLAANADEIREKARPQHSRFSENVDGLWRLLIHHASLPAPNNVPYADGIDHALRVESLARQLLSAFSLFRQRLLLRLLLGWSIQETASEQRVTERTVAATRQAALDLLG
jgi:hypothetical protein